MSDRFLLRQLLLTPDPWEQLVLWGKTDNERIRDMAIARVSFGERYSRPVLCVPCQENRHKECVKSCNCRALTSAQGSASVPSATPDPTGQS